MSEFSHGQHSFFPEAGQADIYKAAFLPIVPRLRHLCGVQQHYFQHILFTAGLDHSLCISRGIRRTLGLVFQT